MLKEKTFKNFIRKNKKLEELIFKEQYTMFFEYEGELFAAKEDDRLIFAKIKNKDKDIDWKNSKFIGDYIIQKLKKEEKSKYFNQKDIEKIKILQLDEINKKLKNAK